MDFYKRMGLVCQAVPEGKVATYGQIALLCGFPGHARQVGFGLNRNLAGGVPAHRIVNSQGYLTGASSFEYYGLQKRLLEAEGVIVSAENRVDLKRFGWKNSLETAQQLAAAFQQAGW